jgi:hypothetical protein
VGHPAWWPDSRLSLAPRAATIVSLLALQAALALLFVGGKQALGGGRARRAGHLRAGLRNGGDPFGRQAGPAVLHHVSVRLPERRVLHAVAKEEQEASWPTRPVRDAEAVCGGSAGGPAGQECPVSPIPAHEADVSPGPSLDRSRLVQDFDL